MINKKYLIAPVALIAVLGVIALIVFLPKYSKQTGRINITTSFYPLAFFAEQITAGQADMTNITPSGAEPHDYEPTPRDLAAIEDSDLLIVNGAGLEPWLEDIKKNGKQKNILVVGESLATQQITEENENIQDPHVWLSPLLARQMAESITSRIIEADPTHKEYYQLGGRMLGLKLQLLDEQYRKGLKNCATKNIVTSHAAFGYLASTYDLHQVAIAGLSPDAEPSGQQLAQITKFIKDNKVTYIFFESLVSPKLAETIAKETGAKTLELNPLEGLTSEEISQGQTYITKMEQNLANLKIALDCK